MQICFKNDFGGKTEGDTADRINSAVSAAFGRKRRITYILSSSIQLDRWQVLDSLNGLQNIIFCLKTNK